MRGARLTGVGLLALAALAATPSAARAQQRDYLTGLEADRIREAETSSDRIKLFLGFAADRLKKFQYELARGPADRRRSERLNSLLNAFTGCVDDAVELLELGREKQQDIRAGLKELLKKTKEFLPELERLAAGGPGIESYRATLEDAIEAVRDAQEAATKAEKEYAPPPVRRRP
jgi:hypothetical protein